MNGAASQSGVLGQWYSLPLLWLLFAVSSIVNIEPAPYDLLGLILFGLFFLTGLGVPSGIRWGIVLLLIFIGANIVSAVLAPDPAASIKAISIRFYLVLTWFLFVCLLYESPLGVFRVMWQGYMVAASIAVVVGILGFFNIGGVQFDQLEFGRVRGFFKDPNVYGPFLVPVAMHALARIEVSSGFKMLFPAGLFLFFCFGILLGFSRGSWLNMVISLVLYFLLRFTMGVSPRERAKLLSLIFIALFILIITLAGAMTVDRFSNMWEVRTHVQYYDMDETGRFGNQLAILKGTLVHPFGIAPGMTESWFVRAPHNLYLHILIEEGWVGGLAFFTFIGVTFVKAFRFARQPSLIQSGYIAVLACTAGTLMQSFFIDSTHWRHLYLLLAMLWGPALVWDKNPLRLARST